MSDRVCRHRRRLGRGIRGGSIPRPRGPHPRSRRAGAAPLRSRTPPRSSARPRHRRAPRSPSSSAASCRRRAPRPRRCRPATMPAGGGKLRRMDVGQHRGDHRRPAATVRALSRRVRPRGRRHPRSRCETACVRHSSSATAHPSRSSRRTTSRARIGFADARRGAADARARADLRRGAVPMARRRARSRACRGYGAHPRYRGGVRTRLRCARGPRSRGDGVRIGAHASRARELRPRSRSRALRSETRATRSSRAEARA